MDQTYKKKIRLFCKELLEVNRLVSLGIDDTHYLKVVMRRKIGHSIYLFNEDCGEFEAKIIDFNKNFFVLKILNKVNVFEEQSDLHLLFAPVKRDKTEYIIQKATELGVSKILPVITERTILRNLNYKRLFLIAKEASEQSERLTIPEIMEINSLKNVIDNWNDNRMIFYADETMKKELKLINQELNLNSTGAVLVGPEGGFSLKETMFLKENKFVMPFSLGSRVLRSDTAVIVALTYWNLLNS